MSRQLIVLAAAVAAHLTAVVVVGNDHGPPPTVRTVAHHERAPARVERCQAVTSPQRIVDVRSTPADAGIADADLDASIVAIDATHHTLTAELASRIVWNPMRLAGRARVVPAVRDGRPDGFKLYAIHSGSIAARLGFENGDTVETVDGFEMTSADKALETYEHLREATHFEIGIQRHGVPVTLTITIE